MKPRAFKFSVRAVTCLALALLPLAVARAADTEPAPTAAALDAEATPVADTPPPLGEETPVATVKPLKPGKKAKDPSATPKVKVVKEIPFALTPGDSGHNVRIPQIGLEGQILSQMMAAKMTRLDNEHVQMSELNMDLFHPDGKEDFHIVVPTSIFDLKTHIITSEQPVTVKTADFELTGERMEFNTVDRTGKLLGNVAMHIHNLKQVAAVPGATPVPP